MAAPRARDLAKYYNDPIVCNNLHFCVEMKIGPLVIETRRSQVKKNSPASLYSACKYNLSVNEGKKRKYIYFSIYIRLCEKKTQRKEVFSYLYNTIPFHQWEHPTPLTTGDE